MKNYFKLFVYCPDDKKLINRIIETASENGAGIYGNYSHVAFITHGSGTWKSEKGSHPYEGQIDKITHSKVAKIEMICPQNKAQETTKAIKKIHPWEQVDIEFFQIAIKYNATI